VNKPLEKPVTTPTADHWLGVLLGALRDLPQALTVSSWLAGILIVVVGFTGSLVLTFDVAERAKLTAGELSSWVWAITVGTGLLTLGLSLLYRQPVITAWSTPGLAVLAASLGNYSLNEAVGAYIAVALAIVFVGLTGLFERAMRFVPQGVALAVLAGVLFKYGLGLFTAAQPEPVLVLGMIAVFLLAKLLKNRVPMAWALLAGFGLAFLLGKFQVAGISLQLAQPLFFMPSFNVAAIIGLGVPLFALALASQNAPGLAVMRAHGYQPPTKGALVGTGLVSVVFAPFLGHGFTLAAITAAIGNSESAHSDPKLRYGAGVTAGILKASLGLFGGTLVALFLALPKPLVAAMAGLALLGTIQNCLVGALQDPHKRDSSSFALLVTASGAEFLGLGSAFWGLLAGSLVSLLLEREKL
jgi:benzoate membrane transport protein